jgi:hypothetical protein
MSGMTDEEYRKEAERRTAGLKLAMKESLGGGFVEWLNRKLDKEAQERRLAKRKARSSQGAVHD